MRRAILAACGLIVSLGVAVAPSQAQSLAELAKVEAARRKAVKTNAAVPTNADLRPSRSSTEGEQSPTGIADAPTVPTAASVVAGPDVAAEASTDEPHTEVPVKAREKRSELYWRGRAADYDGRLTRFRNDVAAIRGRVRALDAQIGLTGEDSGRAATAGAHRGHLDAGTRQAEPGVSAEGVRGLPGIRRPEGRRPRLAALTASHPPAGDSKGAGNAMLLSRVRS